MQAGSSKTQAPPGYMTVPEAAAHLGITAAAVREAIKRGTLQAERLGPRLTVIHQDQIAQYRRGKRGRKGWARKQGLLLVPSGSPEQMAAAMVPFLNALPAAQLRSLLFAVLNSGLADEERITRIATESALKGYLQEVWELLPSELQAKWEAVEQAVQQDMQALGDGGDDQPADVQEVAP